MEHQKSRGLSAIKEIPAMTMCLLRSLPIAVTVIFIVDNILMNLLAGYSLLNLPWLALNWAITVSWVSFLILDIVTKRFGPGAANTLSLIAAVTNMTCALLCFGLSKVFSNPALDFVLGGQWSVFTASTIAFILSSILNNFLNALIGKLFVKNPDGKGAYAARSFVSTFISQFTDNFVFLILAFFIFPLIPSALQVTWTMPQILTCSILCAGLELLSEVLFAPIGYKVVSIWKARNTGAEYIEKYYEEAKA